MKYTAVLLGATGLVGEHLLQGLLENEHFEKVIILTRKPSIWKHAKLKNIVTDFSDIGAIMKDVNGSVLFSCLGTTRKKTPDLDQYRYIETGIPTAVAQHLKHNGLQQIHLVSAIGVNERSHNFYIKIKHEAETSVTAINAEATYIYRPALIVGNRKEFRLAEKVFVGIFKMVDLLLWGYLKKYRSINAHQIAKKMLTNSLNPQQGKHIVYFP